MTTSTQAQSTAPWVDASWLRILHYQATLLGSWQSSITSSPFFLDPHAVTNPEAEWNALQQGAEGPEAASIACRFPARVLIYQKLTGKTWPVSPCSDYLEWKKRLEFHSISLVYSTAYAGNPASVLGHNMIKLNRFDPALEDNPESGLPLLDYGIGFLARHDPDDGPVAYVANGLFGGYPGFFVLQPYYELVNTYAYAENRDLWELELSLTPSEREIFLAHVWELIHQASAPYYFTHVNCSTMLLELLESIRPSWNFRDRIHGLVLPQAVMQTVAEVVGHGHENFWPSQKRIFQEHWQHLQDAQREKFLDWRASSHTVAVSDDPLLLDTILHQINLEKSGREAGKQSELRAQEDQILLARARLPATVLAMPEPSQARNNPMLAHGLHKFTLLGGREKSGQLMALRLRWGLHDLLDEPQGFDPYYHINFLDLSLWQRPQEEVDYHLEVVDLMSLMPFEAVDPTGSWAMACGVHREDDGPRPHCRGAYGLAFEMKADRTLFYFLPGMNLTITNSLAELRLGWYQVWTQRWRQVLEIVPRKNLDAQAEWRWDWNWEQRWSFDRSWQLEMRLAREGEWQSLIGLGQFF